MDSTYKYTRNIVSLTQVYFIQIYNQSTLLFISINMSRAKVYDIYMDSNIGAVGSQRHLTDQIKYYSKPIIASDANNYIDEAIQYDDIRPIPDYLELHKIKNRLETAVCVCMYNEGQDALVSTLQGIYKNLEQYQNSDTGKQPLAVFVIQDGILKCDESIISFLNSFEPFHNRSNLKARRQLIKYQTESVKRKKRQINPVGGDDFPWSIPRKTSLMYELQWCPNGASTNAKLKLFFVFKHLNGKKLSSHAWFFEGFCRYLQPEFCILLDVGTVPQSNGIVNMVKVLRSDEKIGGVSGFMNIDANLGSEGIPSTNTEARILTQEQSRQNLRERLPQFQIPQMKTSNSCSWFKNCFLSIEKAQASQYIMAHFLDKNFQSSLGFLHVLPGAWSGYRLKALQTGQIYERDILQKKYFRTIINPDQKLQEYQKMKTANMYLAEDRILSLAIYCQRNKDFYLKYVPNAKAKTDPMKNEVDLSLQRRRWINSSLYAFEYVKANYECDMANSKHSSWDKVRMHFNIFMSTLNFYNTSLIPCFFLFVFFSTINNNGLIENQLARFLIAIILSAIYIIIVIIAIGGSLSGNIWIRDIYQRDRQGNVKLKDGLPVKLNSSQKINGNAQKITILLAIYNFLWTIAVATFTIDLVIAGIRKWINHQAILIQQVIIMVFLFINIGMNILLLLVHLPTHPYEVYQLIIGSISSLFYLSLYTHTMVIFSICNVDDTSWGTKGATDKETGSDFSKQKSYFVGGWMLRNALICFIFFLIDSNSTKPWVTLALACYATITFTIKCLIAIINQLRFMFCCCC